MKKRIRHGNPQQQGAIGKRWCGGGGKAANRCGRFSAPIRCGSRPSISGGVNWPRVVAAPAIQTGVLPAMPEFPVVGLAQDQQERPGGAGSLNTVICRRGPNDNLPPLSPHT